MASISTQSGFALSENYPNPFNHTTEISYMLPESAKVTLTISNSLGQVMSTLVNASQDAGTYKVSFDAGSMAAGMYSYTIDVNGLTQSFTATKIMVKTE
ncbi:MAG: T9SS type A sorting domain-containing protein [Bacteroidia bacterium]|nr:T9SS type A sorting domain-containing protein [Bacteroidia bacterium]